MIFVDTVTWLYLFDKGQSDSKALIAKQYLKTIQTPLCTSDFVIEETHKWLIHHGRPSHLALELLKKLNQQIFAQIIGIEPEDRIHAVELVEKYADQPLSYTDALTVAMMRRLGLKQIFSFDKHFLLFPELERVPT